DGTATYDESIAYIKQASRNYAKRQLTWFRRIPSLTWIDNTDPVATAKTIADCYQQAKS
ncbi:MAG: tRNA (adenosine(37)-N6)-dimethylallyltransferase MiaA, partial [Saccharofermentanales bacterium]